MAREVMIHTWCDVCIAQDVDGDTRRVPSVASHELTLDGKSWTLDLCETHEAAYYKPFAALVADVGATGPAAPAKAARTAPKASDGAPKARATHRRAQDSGKALPIGVVCPLENCGQPYYGRSLGALQQHMRTIHNIGMEAFGQDCPVCGNEYPAPQAMASHVRAAHMDVFTAATDPGVDFDAVGHGIAAAWWWASNHGDPHGVVATSGLNPWVAGGVADEADTLPLGA